MGSGLFPGEFLHRLGRANAGHDVFPLGIHQEFAVENLFAGRRIARERDAGAGLLAGVAEDHCLHVDGGAPLGRDVVFAAIDDGPVVHPGAENSADGALELIPRIARKCFASALFNQSFKSFDQLLEVVGHQPSVLQVVIAVTLVLEAADDGLERLVVLARALLHTQHHVAIHLNEAAIAVPGETLVVRGFDEREHGFVVQAEIQNGVHHPRHRIARAGTHRHEERHAFGVAELRAHDSFHVGDASLDLRLELPGISPLVRVVISADLGGDGETRRDGQADAGHFGKVRAFAAEEGLHGAVAVSLLVSKQINVLPGLAHKSKGLLSQSDSFGEFHRNEPRA